MKEVKLTGKYGKGKVTVVNDEDYDYLSQFKWHLNKGYPERSLYNQGKVTHIKMHRELMNPPIGFVVDHINGDKLDNRRENLRICTQRQNAINKRKNSNNTSGYKGVSFSKKQGKFSAYVSINGNRRHIGYFEDPEEAARAYDFYASKHFKEFAVVNFPGETQKEPKKKKYTSKYRGVSWGNRDKVWRPQIVKNGARYSLGSFTCEHQAALAYNQKALELFGDKAKLNKVEEVFDGYERT